MATVGGSDPFNNNEAELAAKRAAAAQAAQRTANSVQPDGQPRGLGQTPDQNLLFNPTAAAQNYNVGAFSNPLSMDASTLSLISGSSRGNPNFGPGATSQNQVQLAKGPEAEKPAASAKKTWAQAAKDLATATQVKSSLAGPDRVMNPADVMSAVASLLKNDTEIEKQAINEVANTIMPMVAQKAQEELEKAKQTNPEFRKGLEAYKKGTEQLTNGMQQWRDTKSLTDTNPITRLLAASSLEAGAKQIEEGQKKLKEGAELLHEKTTGQVNDVIKAVDKDIPLIARTMAALEARDQLSKEPEFQSVDTSSSPSDKAAAAKDALDFYSRDPDSDSPVPNSKQLEEARNHFMNLSPDDIKAEIASSLAKTQDISGGAKNILSNIDYVLSFQATVDPRAGLTQDSLATAKEVKQDWKGGQPNSGDPQASTPRQPVPEYNINNFLFSRTTPEEEIKALRAYDAEQAQAQAAARSAEALNRRASMTMDQIITDVNNSSARDTRR